MRSPDEKIPLSFLQYAADILGDTNKGLSGAKLMKELNGYAVEYDVHLPVPRLEGTTINKRTVLLRNIEAFSSSQQYVILKALVRHSSFPLLISTEREELIHRLVMRYGHLDPHDAPAEVNLALIEETKHWLDGYPQSLDLYEKALQKYELQTYERNLLDDLRLALELLLKSLFSNNKSLENQLANIGQFIKERKGSSEFANMFTKLLDYYCKYQNNYIKHDDAVIEEEIEFVIEITSSFMKHLVRLADS
ncbi:hypothetical protein K5D33_21105 [Pseudomonas cichorii]|nr:hypothetical protein [Pseudomonas cichorii]MBX8537205.1 hypothetical protein [Pseudomonas cichorii]